MRRSESPRPCTPWPSGSVHDHAGVPPPHPPRGRSELIALDNPDRAGLRIGHAQGLAQNSGQQRIEIDRRVEGLGKVQQRLELLTREQTHPVRRANADCGHCQPTLKGARPLRRGRLRSGCYGMLLVEDCPKRSCRGRCTRRFCSTTPAMDSAARGESQGGALHTTIVVAVVPQISSGFSRFSP